MFDFNKNAFDKSFAAMVVMQDQAEKMFGLWLNQNKWFPEEGKKALAQWTETYKKGREEFKSKVEEGYKQMEQYFAGPEK
jgi:predicted aminopeptidase